MSEPSFVCIDTSVRDGLVTFCRGEHVIGIESLDPTRGHNRDLSAAIKRILDTNGVAIGDLAAIGVNVGPGSFTGIRVAIATVKAIAYVAQVRLVAVTTFDLVAATMVERRGRIIIDFQLNSWLVGDYSPGTGIGPVREVVAGDDGQLVDDDWPLIGPGAIKFAKKYPRALRLANNEWQTQPADLLAVVGQQVQAGRFVDPWVIEPFYAAVSSAERIWDARRPTTSE